MEVTTCLDTGAVASELFCGLLKVLMRELPASQCFFLDAINSCLDSFHDLLTHEHVFLWLDLCLKVPQVLIRENFRQLFDNVVLCLKLARGLLELNLAAIKLSRYGYLMM